MVWNGVVPLGRSNFTWITFTPIIWFSIHDTREKEINSVFEREREREGISRVNESRRMESGRWRETTRKCSNEGRKRIRGGRSEEKRMRWEKVGKTEGEKEKEEKLGGEKENVWKSNQFSFARFKPVVITVIISLLFFPLSLSSHFFLPHLSPSLPFTKSPNYTQLHSQTKKKRNEWREEERMERKKRKTSKKVWKVFSSKLVFLSPSNVQEMKFSSVKVFSKFFKCWKFSDSKFFPQSFPSGFNMKWYFPMKQALLRKGWKYQ